MKLQGAIGGETVRDVNIAAGNFLLQGMLGVPANAAGVVLFAHGSGSGRFSPRNQFVAERLRAAGLATLLVDLLTEAEEQIDDETGALRFDIPFLAARLMGVTDWLGRQPLTRMLPVGLWRQHWRRSGAGRRGP